MSPSISKRLQTLGLVVATGLATVMACSDGGNGGTGPGSISITLSPTSATVEQGSSTDVTGTITRSGGFTGTVNFTVDGAPAGVDGSVSNIQTSNNTTTATITITVAASTAPGVYNLTVRGSGSGVAAVTAAFQLIVPSPPGYTLALDPATLTIEQGSTGQSAVTIARVNFTGAVSLSLGGAPTGVTGTFDPAAPTGTSATLTVSVEATAAPGVYNLTVDGSGSPGNESTALTLTVAEPPSYSLAVDPASLTIEQGMSDGATVTITRTNFTGAVTLSLGGAPAGVTGTFNPDAPTGTTSALTVAVDVTTAPGTYNLTVDGTGSAGNESAALTLTVTAAPASYTMTLTPAALSLEQGGSGSSEVSLARINFTDGVTLSLEGAPTGVTHAFNPTPATGDASTLTIDVGATVAPGSYPLTVRGVATGLEDRTATLTLTVGTFSLSVDPNALTIQQGMSDQTTVTINRTNFTGTVTFSLGNAPTGVAGTFDPTSTTGTTSTLTLDVDGTVAAGVYNLTVVGSTGSSGGAAAATSPAVDMEAALTLTVTEVPDYSLALEPSTLTIEQGMSGQSAVTITRTNFTGAVTLSLEGTPTGVTGTFDPAAPTGATSTLTVQVDGTVPAGDYNLTVDGTGSAGDRSTPLTLTVAAAPDYSLALDPAAVTIEQGDADQIAVGITRTNFTDAVTLSLEGEPTGVTATFNPAAPTGVGSILTVNVDGTTTPGVYNLTVDGTSSIGDRSTPLTLTVVEPPSFSLSVNPDSIAVEQGTTGQATVTITRVNFPDGVTLSLDSAPAGMSGAFMPAAPTGNTSTLTVTVGASVAPGTYDLKVNGAGGGLDADVDFKVTVTEVPGFSLSASPSGATVAPTSTPVSTINIIRTGGFTGNVDLAVSGMPPGMNAALNPTSTTGNSSTLSVTLSGVADGTYPLTISGDAAPLPQATTTFTVTVVTGGGGTVIADFSTCDLEDRPIWLAYQDGTTWTQVIGMTDVYTFTLNSSKGGVAWVTQDAMGDRDVTVIYATAAELGMGLFVVCDPSGTKTVNATVAGLDMGDLANLYLGSTAASTIIAANGPVQFTEVPAGPQNVVGFKSAAGDPSMNARMYIDRGRDIANMGSLGTVDFAGGNSFAPETKTVTVAGLGAGETYGAFHSFLSLGSCQEASLHSVVGSGSSFQVHGAPSANLLSTDIHSLTVTATPSAIPFDRSRGVTDNRNALSNFTLTLPPEMADPTITSLGGNYLRLQGSVALASEYAGFALFGYSNTNSDRSVNISATSGWLGSSTAVLGLGDFSGVSGWMDSYAPAPTDMAEWLIFGFGGSIFEDDCTVGTSASASRSGTFP